MTKWSMFKKAELKNYCQLNFTSIKYRNQPINALNISRIKIIVINTKYKQDNYSKEKGTMATLWASWSNNLKRNITALLIIYNIFLLSFGVKGKLALFIFELCFLSYLDLSYEETRTLSISFWIFCLNDETKHSLILPSMSQVND